MPGGCPLRIAREGKGDKEVAVINRVESTWVRTPDALSRQRRRERRRPQQDKEKPEESQDSRPVEEKRSVDLVA